MGPLGRLAINMSRMSGARTGGSATLGPAGTVDFAALARGAGGREWSDPDFRPDDSALWIDPNQPGGGAIGAILDMRVLAFPCGESVYERVLTAGFVSVCV